ncbi:MAG: DUF1338 domain-containing protein [Pirellulales bacterium]
MPTNAQPKAKKQKIKASPATTALGAPHCQVEARDDRDRFTLALFDALWTRYRQRVEYVQRYEEVVAAAGASFVNDHIAFRTIACQRPTVGISGLARIFCALGYAAAGNYQFPDKQLASVHLQHPVAGFPKLFISELELWNLPADVRKTILRTVQTHRDPLSDSTLASLAGVNELSPDERGKLLKKIVAYIQELPWDLPPRKDVEAVNQASQFAAWVLVHGYNVNHFTALINSHGVPALDDIEKTIAALTAAGVPMKTEIEGAAGSKLRQTATAAVMLDVDVRQGGKRSKMPWTYAYFELAERGDIKDPASGQSVRFEGFLGPQATQLFEMTRVS